LLLARGAVDSWGHHRLSLAARTDPRRLFDAYCFEVVGNPDGGKQRVRKRLT
jgi:hypothetical protein